MIKMAVLECMHADRKLEKVNERFDEDLVREIEKRVWQNPDLYILDIGCGKNGNSIEDIAKIYPGVTAIGMDPNCHTKHQRKSSLVSGDLFYLPFRSQFDIVYSAFVLLYVGFLENHKDNHAIAKSIIEISNVLKPKGVAMITESRYAGEVGGLNELTRQICSHSTDYLKRFQLSDPGNNDYRYIRVDRI
jgi:ubiquinone/menaquinone biosynthesis C-methylase UbiE